MAEVRSCNIPEDLYYLVEKHVWGRREGDEMVVGLSDVAQHLAKTIISVTLKEPGKPIRKGRSIATVESGKWVGPVPSPVSGSIVAVNEALRDDPATLNRDPYGAGWIARVACADWEADAADLVTGAEAVARYQAFLEAEGISCGEG
ncbi:glycine cleavage system protein GcvH [Aciditerrimonas ferrireducens]|jgi:glycine cleavage system H protein|uniref:Glycine cleavage system H protein n=2 Tax=Aciditerrimonas ferrireducens TaxID=667306 RepID=A0ABV6C1A7_9ACTN